MILDKKIEIMIEKRYIKEKLLKYYFFMFLSLFLFFINLYLKLELIFKNQTLIKSIDINKIKTMGLLSSFFVWISLVFISYLLIIWFLSSLASILLNRYYKFNIFRSIKWLKVKLFTLFKFTLLDKFKQSLRTDDKKTLEFIQYMQKNNFIIHGSKSIALKYTDYWRETNDLDFMSMSLNSNFKDLNQQENVKINFVDNISAKLELQNENNANVEVLIAKYIPSQYIKTLKEIKIPNIEWMIAMKIHQLFRFYLLEKNKVEVSESKIKNSLLDLAFLFSKTKTWKMKKIINTFADLYLSNFFISYYINTYCFDLTNSEEAKNLLAYLKTNIQKNETIDELSFFFDELFEELQNNKEIQLISNKINNIVKNKEELEIKFIEASSSKDKEISTLKRLFLSKIEKENFIKKQYNNSIIENKYIDLYIKDFQKDEQKDEQLDVRQILLLELNKQIKEGINE